MNGQFWQAAPQMSLQDFPKAHPFCYVQYLQLYCFCECVCFLAGVQAIYNIPANLILLSSSFWDIISCFSYLLHVIAIVAVCRLTFLLNPWEDTALDRVSFESTLQAFIELARNTNTFTINQFIPVVPRLLFGRYLYDSMQFVDSQGCDVQVTRELHLNKLTVCSMVYVLENPWNRFPI